MTRNRVWTRTRLAKRLVFILSLPFLLFTIFILSEFGIQQAAPDLPETHAVSKVWDGGGDGTTWESANNWNPDGVPGSGDDVTIDANVTVTLNAGTTINSLVLGNSSGTTTPTLEFAYDSAGGTPLTLNSAGQGFFVHPNATITHSGNSSTRAYTISIVTNNNATVNGNIDADGKGFSGGLGNRAGTSVSGIGGGGGHTGSGGGAGAGGTVAAVATSCSTAIGGSGGQDIGTPGAGGGLIELTVPGTFTMNGVITADGTDASGTGDSGGGAGGSICINTGTITGTGTMSADGGDGTTNGGGGGGGRVVMICTTSCDDSIDNATDITAIGGNDTSSIAHVQRWGGAGTVYDSEPGAGNNNLRIQNNGRVDTYKDTREIGLTDAGTVSVEVLEINNEGNLELKAGDTTTVTGSLTWATAGTEASITDNGGTMADVTNGNLSIPQNAVLYSNDSASYVSGVISGTLTHSNNTTTKTNFIDHTYTSGVNITTFGNIDASNRGYENASGPGAGSTSTTGSGGGYGGEGGDAGSTNGGIDGIGTGGSAFGTPDIITEIKTPDDMGSGGGNDVTNRGGFGGGYISINTNGSVIITGPGGIIADGGTPPLDQFDVGGGAGGGIYIDADQINGSGIISAVGGDGRNFGSGGGGGRIALYFTSSGTSSFPFSNDANVQINGGSSENLPNERFGGSGTYFRVSTGNGILKVDNADQFENGDDLRIGRTPIAGGTLNILDLNILTIEDGGNLELVSGATTNYNTLNWSNEARITDNGGLLTNVTGGTLVLPSTSKLFSNTGGVYGDITINGTLTHSNNTDTQANDISLTVSSGGNFTIGATGTIDVDGRGYYSGQGPSAGTLASGAAGGGGNGGEGGDGGDTAGGSGGVGTTGGAALFTDTNLKDPANMGSGGGNELGPGGRGGGYVSVNVINGVMTIGGPITADGTNGTAFDQGGGAGGAVNLEANYFDGSSTITVTGGSGNLNGGGGGGGRIGLFYDSVGTFPFDTNYDIKGGTSGSLPNARFGGSGTYYRWRSTWTAGEGLLIIDNGNQDENGDNLRIGLTPVGNQGNIRGLYLRNSGNMLIDSSTNLAYTNTFLWDTGRITDNGGGTFAPITGGGTLSVPTDTILYANAERTFTTFTVNGTLTHSNNTSTETNKIYLHMTTLDVNSGASIDVDERGYLYGSGPGGGTTASNTGSGGGHGGEGGATNGSNGGVANGSPTIIDAIRVPVSIGSGGGYDLGAGGRGGGAIRLDVNGDATINGTLSANGESRTFQDQGGGAGGSIFIDVLGTISGTFTATANGGNGNANGGGGGGGRISIQYEVDSATETLQAYGGTMENSPNNRFGGAGTIYQEDITDNPNGILTIDNNNLDALNDYHYGKTPISYTTGTLAVNTFELLNDGHLDLTCSCTLSVAGVDVWGDGHVTDGGGTYDNATGNTVTVPAQAKLYANQSRTHTGTFTINGTLTHSKNNTAETYKIDRTVGILDINSGGAIDVSGQGYTAQNGPGAGSDAGLDGTGGGYGGLGGGTSQVTNGGSAYDSGGVCTPGVDCDETTPTNIGSGGGNDIGAGGDGGGAVKITVTGATATIDGPITADGGGTPGIDGGGGSGGSVWIDASTTPGAISGTALISANGGDAYDGSAGQGAGGRVRLDCSGNTLTLEPTATKASIGYSINPADDGTVSYGSGCGPNATPAMIPPYGISTTAYGTPVSPLTLTTNQTTTYYIYGRIRDTDGYEDITDVDVVFYRSGVGSSCTADNNDCYILTNCPLTNGSGTDVDFSCQVDLEYYTDATGPGGTYQAETWNYRVSMTDGGGVTQTSAITNEIQELVASSTTASINYGPLSLGATSTSSEQLVITNAGNANVIVSGYMSADMTCDNGSIPVANNKWDLTDVAYASMANNLSGTTTQFVNLARRTDDGTPSDDIVYWRIQIPSLGVVGSCAGTLTITTNEAP